MKGLTPLLWICIAVLFVTIFSSTIGNKYNNNYPTTSYNYPTKVINEFKHSIQTFDNFNEPPSKRKERVNLEFVTQPIEYNTILHYPNNTISLNPVNSILGMEQANTTWSNLVNISSTSSRNGYPRYLNISTDGGLTTGKTIVIR
jgi:hypothetical protein